MATSTGSETVEAATQDKEAYLKITKYPLVKRSDMLEDMLAEAVELVITAVEKHSDNLELAARVIKENMDKKFGPPWHSVVGEYFSFEISHEVRNLLYLFCSGTLAVVVWKQG